MTGDGEFAAVEDFVRQCTERMTGTPYLAPDPIPQVFLEELAHEYERHRRQALDVSSVAGATRLVWPPDMAPADRHAAVEALLCDSGIATVVHGEFRFASESARRYLAARHVVRQNENGRRYVRYRMSKYLEQRPDWEPTEEFTRFLVILWWRTARQEVVKHLGKLLDERTRHPNIFFVADLCRRGVLIGSDLPDRTVEALRAEVRTADRPEDAWRDMVTWLATLDPAAAVTELEDVVHAPKPDMTVSRAYIATTELATRDPARAAAALTHLADHLWGEPQDQVAVAVLIAGDHPELGARALERLARDTAIGESRVDAALHVDAPRLWRELTTDQLLSDDGRLRLLAALLERHPATARTVVPSFLPTTQDEHTRIRVAELVAGPDAALAWEVAADVAFTTQRRVDSMVRLAAALLLGRLDPARSWTVLERLSAMPGVAGDVRLRAALTIAEQGGEPRALAALPHAAELEVGYRAEAAKHLAARDAVQGAHAYIAVAQSCGVTRQGIDFLRAAHDHAPVPAAQALAAVAEDERFPDEYRFEAIQLADPSLPRTRRIEVHAALARTAASHDTAMRAAARVKTIDPAEGERAWAVVAQRDMPDEWQIHAAREAGRSGKRVLIQLTHRVRKPMTRLQAAIALEAVDPRKSERTFAELVDTRGEVRIQAAQHLPGPVVLQALLTVVSDHREREDVRYAAAEAAMAHDEERARWSLREVLPHLVPARLRDRVTWLSQR